MTGTWFLVWSTVDRTRNSTFTDKRKSEVHIRENILMMKIMKQCNEIARVEHGVSFSREV